jgi:hypothetical protein
MILDFFGFSGLGIIGWMIERGFRDGKDPNQAKVIGENTISLSSTRGRTAGFREDIPRPGGERETQHDV